MPKAGKGDINSSDNKPWRTEIKSEKKEAQCTRTFLQMGTLNKKLMKCFPSSVVFRRDCGTQQLSRMIKDHEDNPESSGKAKKCVVHFIPFSTQNSETVMT